MTTAPGQVQQRPLRPASIFPQGLIRFLHPGYEAPFDRLLNFPRVDHKAQGASGASVIYGIHHGTALLACQIIAGNAFDNSYLALDKDGQKEVQAAPDDILVEDNYYFIVRGSGMHSLVLSLNDHLLISLTSQSCILLFQVSVTGNSLTAAFPGAGFPSIKPFLAPSPLIVPSPTLVMPLMKPILYRRRKQLGS
jgi:hypothetical protein